MDELIGRIKTAIEFLKDSFPFKIDRLYMGISENGYLNVTGASKYSDLKYITKQVALIELNEIKSLFNKMTSISSELTIFVSDKQIKFNIDFDYGMGDIRICSEVNGVLKWEIDIKQ